MATKFKSITAFLVRVSKDMIREQAAQGIRNTGRSARSLQIFPERIEGVGYWNFLFSGQGTRPTRKPVSLRGFMQWVRARGLKWKRESGKPMPLREMAWLVRRKVTREGTEIFKKPREGVNLDSILERHEDQLTDELSTEIQQTFIQDLNKVIIRQ